MNDAATRSNTHSPAAPSPALPPRPPHGLLSWLAASVPTVLALALLGGLGAWGYFHDWTIPSFNKVFGKEKKEESDWCDKHAAPKDACVECNEKLLPRPPKYGWCKTHGVHDCTLDHPDVAQLDKAPPISDADRQRAARALAFAPRKANEQDCPYHPRRLQLASQEAFERTGIKLKPVKRGYIAEGVMAPGEIIYDPTRVARVSSRVAGTVRRVFHVLGDKVKRGEVLALVDSMAVGRAKADLLQAAAQFNLQTQTLQRLEKNADVIPRARLLEAQTGLQEAKIRLLGAQQALESLGLPVQTKDFKGLEPEELARLIQRLGLPADLGSLAEEGLPTANLLPIRSPLDGEVVGRQVVAGEVIDPNKLLLTVADTSKLWLTLNVRQEESGRVALGDKITFQSSAGGQSVEDAKVSWISPSVDEKTRTVMVRAELDNQSGKLRSNTYGTGRIILREDPQAITVPSGAVHWDGHCNVVFVLDRSSRFVLNKEQSAADKDKPVVFHVRNVRVGVREGGRTEIIAGVLPGEYVADENSEVLRGQLLRDQLAGD
jgi:cobalt-zinc-cadmium efflux system membrane fusion protein